MDTPGIGESNEMKQVLRDYIEHNQIYGFIYVIKSDNAGGLAEDRVNKWIIYMSSLKSFHSKVDSCHRQKLSFRYFVY